MSSPAEAVSDTGPEPVDTIANTPSPVLFALLTAICAYMVATGTSPVALYAAVGVFAGVLTWSAAAEPPRGIRVDDGGLTLLDLPTIPWDNVTAVGIKRTTSSRTHRTYQVLVIRVKDHESLDVARGSRPRWARSPLRRIGEHAHPEAVSVLLPKDTADAVAAWVGHWDRSQVI